jgi:hypothetical protein
MKDFAIRFHWKISETMLTFNHLGEDSLHPSACGTLPGIQTTYAPAFFIPDFFLKSP